MKRFSTLFLALAIAVWLLPNDIHAQTTTPNLHLILPEAEPGTWGTDINSNFSTLDSLFPSGQAGHLIEEEGTPLPARTKMNFIGAGVTATDNPGTGATDVTVSISGAGHTIQDEATPLTQRPALNFTGSGVTCTDNSGSNRTDCTIAAGSVDQAAAYTWTGVHSWRDANFSLLDNADITKVLKFELGGFTTGTTRTLTPPNASTRLLGESDFNSLNGFLSRTGSSTFASRTIQGTTNRVTVTNGDGAANNPVINLGSLAVQTDQSNTFSTGDQDLGAAASFTFPKATGATPTLSGRCAYDTTANRLKCGFNGSTVTLAVLSEVQPLSTNLTALAALASTNNTVPIFNGSSMVGSLLPSCADSAGQHLNYDNTTRTFSCGTSSTGGLSGLTTNKYLLATGATSAGTSGVLSESAGVLNVSGGATFGSSPFLIFDTSAIASTDKTWTIINQSGTIRPSTGVLTVGNIITTNANGQLVDGGAAGTGTWTDSSNNTSTGNKTIRDTLAGGTNTLWTPVRASWDAGSLTPDGTNCADPTKQTINSGPVLYAFSCADSNSSTFDGHLTLPITMAGNLATVKFRLTVNDVDSASQVFGGGFKAQCRASGTAPSSTWGTAQTVAITMTTANNDYSATTSAVTPDGTCSAGAELFWRFTVDGTGTNTDDGDARVISVMMEQAS